MRNSVEIRESPATAARGGEPKRGNAISRSLRWLYAPVLAHGRALLVMNAVYFGAFGLGIAWAALAPSVQQGLLDAVGAAYSPTSAFGTVAAAYLEGQLVSAIALTFVVNLVLGTLVYVTLPSLVIPFAGVIVGVLRAVVWGLIFSPFTGVYDLSLLPHVGTMLVEGEAYIIAMLGVWLWWRPVFATPGQRWRAYVRGLTLQGRILVAVAVTLAVAAIYEALEVIYLIPTM